MFIRTIAISLFAGALAVSAGPLFAADQVRDQKQDQMKDQDQERIYGSQLMTQKERNAYRAKMRAAKTVKEREQIRNEHHKLMQLRAQERGVTLPDMPPAGGGMMGPGGMRPGGGMGGGMGPGGGMRQGGGN
ncbi:MAG: hypothetical protein KKG03_02185 [Gammaproteobacteria bacterium]|nr:hypothetical protein [Sideroxydans sp.]MBU3903031.1 hypothetical protein [Gammaproteobacteria bacterium]MBU4046084.1 hypothetical protein [Gammaproteobacteria bacterium]MBU4150438.1 hypothetical protein [Gammaproteobacteria bacterium]